MASLMKHRCVNRPHTAHYAAVLALVVNQGFSLLEGTYGPTTLGSILVGFSRLQGVPQRIWVITRQLSH